MGEDQRCGCCSGEAEDHISGLPDELLHEILVRLRSMRAAARTSILSRRWRRVWTHLPELVLNDSGPDAPRASFMDAIDAVIGACLAPTLDHLTIALSSLVLAGRATPWLRFASQRIVGTFSLSVPPSTEGDDEQEVELELPACAGVKRVMLDIAQHWKLRLPHAGLFTALTSLMIYYGRMEGSEVTALVCTQCPCLKTLTLWTTLVATFDITIRSYSLLSVWLSGLKNTRRLEIVAPRLEQMSLPTVIEARISTPKLAKLVWHGDVYDPFRHRFVDVGCRLQLLQIERTRSIVASFMRQFDEVDDFKLTIYIRRGIEDYGSFLNETHKLPNCKSLSISLVCHDHGLAPTILHLLRSCNITRTLSIALISSYDSLGSRCPPSCHCRFEENCRTDDISLNSLEEVKITSRACPHGELELVEHLSRCNAPILKRLVINNMITAAAPPTNKETREKIRNTCRPNIEVEFYVCSTKGHVRLD